MTAAASDQPGWMDPELATLTRDRFSDPGWIFERKLDGERCLAFRSGTGVRLMTRNQKEDTSTYPEITEALAAQRAGDFIIDGEIVAFDGGQTRFARLQQRLESVIPGRTCSPGCRSATTSSTCCGPMAATCARCRCGSASRSCATC